MSAKRRTFLTGVTLRSIEPGGTLEKASGDLDLYNQEQSDFKAEMQSTDSNLAVQVSRFSHGLDRWFGQGIHHPPYFPWRIAIILSKERQVDRERDFLSSYCDHFGDRKGSRDEMIAARAIKKGAFDPLNKRRVT